MNDDFIILEVSELLQVEILDDGKPVTEDIVITITLSLRGPPPPSIDTIHSVATLIIPAPEGNSRSSSEASFLCLYM